MKTPLEALKYHVTGAIERGEGVAITEQRPAQHTPGQRVYVLDTGEHGNILEILPDGDCLVHFDDDEQGWYAPEVLGEA